MTNWLVVSVANYYAVVSECKLLLRLGSILFKAICTSHVDYDTAARTVDNAVPILRIHDVIALYHYVVSIETGVYPRNK